MAVRELPAAPSFWARHERLLLDVFIIALQSLLEHGDLPRDENEISNRLAVYVRGATLAVGLDFPPKYEMRRQTVSMASIDDPGTRKRPDFTSEIRDPAATAPTAAWLYYHIECKCLGEASSTTWIYNRNYVERGIRRFLDPEHGYGEMAPSGAMIGYVLSMSFEEILEEVNGCLGETSELGAAPPIRFPETWQDGIMRTSQPLDRARVVPRQFMLRHIWVDLRPDAGESAGAGE